MLPPTWLVVLPVLVVAIPAAFAVVVTMQSLVHRWWIEGRSGEPLERVLRDEDRLWTVWPAVASLLVLVWMLARMGPARGMA